ncbi:hypothetical protein H8K90_07305 [Winogradskyella echinorum]|uniref:Uncharacterized protein n=1 Tax=Winogradskyella echinorum TaxID=538189 RepID=A0ABR6Y0J8_9FLAO|nr:hypothetical protein [Winogradskyella echinorum]MBC3846179.1 hypothetical protein [Winogradskyella echinorum]MBC5750527.1 hypothetical protein [Winogradskyella echinorum]
MKKLGTLIFGIILGALAMYLYYNYYGVGMEQPPIGAPKGIITPKEAIALDKAFNIKHRIINDSLFKDTKIKDNRSSWWSIEDIQSYINYAENQAGELGYSMDGLRVYLGSHPSINGQAGLTTMFLIPTGKLNTSQGNILPIFQGPSNDIKGADGLNLGHDGVPPSSNYPQ